MAIKKQIPDEEDFEFEMSQPGRVRCRIKKGWSQEGRKGYYYGWVAIEGRQWALVLFDDDEDPDLMKLESIELQKATWFSVDA